VLRRRTRLLRRAGLLCEAEASRSVRPSCQQVLPAELQQLLRGAGLWCGALLQRWLITTVASL
jgi:hypothetical protein